MVFPKTAIDTNGLIELAKSVQVLELYLFGSVLREDFHQESDIDILIEFDRETYSNFIRLAYFHEDNLERTVDLLTSDSLSPYIGPTILREVEYVSL
ncbi:MAG: nucleotidyltransferase domain-containing protein [Spirochaetales bacterium]